MKRNVAGALALWFILGNAVLAQEGRPVRSISVSGTVETKTVPDHIEWTIRLRDTDKDMRLAKTRSDEKVKAVVALREKLGIGEGDLETGPVYIDREYERDQQGRQGDLKYFVVSRSVTIRQRDLKRFDDFMDTLVSSAEMEVGFSFKTSRIYEIRAETRLKALQAARDKAAAMVEVVGAKLGPVVTINENQQGDSWRQQWSNSHIVESTPTTDLATDKSVPGAITVQMTVYATFAIE